MRNFPWWIKERHNPQLGIYYVPCGPMSKKEAKLYESTPYGSNVMLRYETKSEYMAAILALKKRAENVQ